MRTFREDVQRATRNDRLCRALDLIGAACAILFMLPLLGLVTALMACDSGPVVVRRRHVREDGSCCYLLKFRTHRATSARPNNRANPDPQSSSLGAILRATGLDELPTLFNIFAGELPICGHYSWRQVVAWLRTPETQDS
jgi:lipopolysaccharide/colanic/teichoic acid biosynthesis glycosyltransferase